MWRTLATAPQNVKSRLGSNKLLKKSAHTVGPLPRDAHAPLHCEEVEDARLALALALALAPQVCIARWRRAAGARGWGLAGSGGWVRTTATASQTGTTCATSAKRPTTDESSTHLEGECAGHRTLIINIFETLNRVARFTQPQSVCNGEAMGEENRTIFWRRGRFVGMHMCMCLYHHSPTRAGKCDEGCRDSSGLVGVVVLTLSCFIIIINS